MTPETNLARFIKKFTPYTLKEIASKLDVTQTALKSYTLGGDNDYQTSFQVECKLPEILNLDYGLLPVQMFTNNTDSEIWHSIISELIDTAVIGAETGYNTPLLSDGQQERATLIQDIVCNLMHCDLSFPDTVPQEFVNYLKGEKNNSEGDNHIEPFFHAIKECETTHILLKTLKALTDLYGYHYAYILPLEDAVDFNNPAWEKLNTTCNNIDSYLLELAFAQIARDRNPLYYNTIINKVSTFTEELKKLTFHNNIPLENDPTLLTTLSHHELGHMAEAKALGCLKNTYHPDYRINNLYLQNNILEDKVSLLMKHLNVTDEDLQKIADEEE